MLDDARLLLWEINRLAGVITRAKLVDHSPVRLGKVLSGSLCPQASIGVSIERYIGVRFGRYESWPCTEWLHLVGRRFDARRAVCILERIHNLVSSFTLLLQALFLQRDEVFSSTKYASWSVVSVRRPLRMTHFLFLF